MKRTCQLKRAVAAFLSLIRLFSVAFPESSTVSSSAKLFKKVTVSGRPKRSPWRISKSSRYLQVTMWWCLNVQVVSSWHKTIPRSLVIKSTHEAVRKLSSFISAVGDPVRSPSSFSALAYQSGIQRSLPGALCSWYPRTMASRNLLAPLS